MMKKLRPLPLALTMIGVVAMTCWWAMVHTVTGDDHQRIVGIHIFLVSIMGSSQIIAFFLLVQHFLHALVAGGKSFDEAATMLSARLRDLEGTMTDVRRVQMDLARDIGGMDTRMRVVEERRAHR
jgi:hypothetical protein